MIDLATLYNPQYAAVTGTRRRVPVNEFILAQLPAMRKAYEDKARYDLEKEAVEQQAMIHDEEMRLAREAHREGQKQAGVATGINLASAGIQTGYMGKQLGWWGGKAAPVAGGTNLATLGSTATPATTVAPAAAAAPEAGALLAYEPAPAAASTAAPAAGAGSVAGTVAGVGAIELAGRGIHGWAEEQGGRAGGTLELTARRAGQGAVIGGGYGAAIGAGVGLVEGILTGGEGACMIVSACMGRESYDVDIARAYRNRFVDRVTLRGYYMIAEWIVPWMECSPGLKRLVRCGLVKPLIDYALWKLSHDPDISEPHFYTRSVSRWFMRLCRRMGATRSVYIRLNGERV